MESDNLLIAMVEECRRTIRAHRKRGFDQPPALHPQHLNWMCSRLIDNVSNWDHHKMNRWIGFIQCAMMANRMIDLEEAKVMFDPAKNAFGEPDRDLTDHLDVNNSFKLEIGGEG